jgi:hypothetical protein
MADGVGMVNFASEVWLVLAGVSGIAVWGLGVIVGGELRREREKHDYRVRVGRLRLDYNRHRRHEPEEIIEV